MSSLSNKLDEFEEEPGGESRGSSHAMWSRRRQAKLRTQARVKRRGASVVAQKGMHMRRNKRMSW